MKKFTISSFLIVFLLLVATANATDYYTHAGYTSVDYSDNVDYGLSFNYSGLCGVQMRATNTFTSPLFDSTGGYYSPDSNNFANSPLTGIGNTTCLSWGQTNLVTTTYDPVSLFYESKFTYTQSATAGFVNTLTRYQCIVTDADHYMRFTVGNTSSDSRGNCLWKVRTNNGGDDQAAWLTALEGNYGMCGDTTDWEATDCSSVLANGGGASTLQYIYPFNSSYSGIINYSFTNSSLNMTQTPSSKYYVHLLNTASGTSTQIHYETDGGSAKPVYSAFSGTQTLSQNTIYLWVITYVPNEAVAWQVTNVYLPVVEMQIFSFKPDYVCGDYSECQNNTHTQVCEDSNGIAPDELRFGTCFDIPAVDLNLGFEEYYTQSVYTCQKGWWITGCPTYLNITTARYPVNWTVINTEMSNIALENFLTLTSEIKTTDGSRALKMWYIPPKPEEPFNNSGTAQCGNVTGGRSPEVDAGYNESLFIAFNVSFENPYLQLRYDVKKCDVSQMPVQYDYTGDFFVNCGKRCYSTNCIIEPKGRYGIRLVDTSTNEIVMDFIENLYTNDWRFENILDLSNVGLETDHNYTLAIGVNPENNFDSNSHCIFIDNFRGTFTDIALPTCESDCDGRNWIKAELMGNICHYQTTYNAKNCFEDEDKQREIQDILDGKSVTNWTCDGTTQLIYDSESGMWDEIENSDVCIAEAESEADLEANPTLDETFVILSSIPFVFSLIIMLLSMVVSVLTKSWQLASIGFAQFIFVASVQGLISSLFAIGELVITIGIIAYLISKPASGNNGGG